MGFQIRFGHAALAVLVLSLSAQAARAQTCTLDCRVQSPSSPYYVFTVGMSIPFTVVSGPSGSCATIYNYFDFGDGTSPKDGTSNNFTHAYTSTGYYDWTYRAYENKTGGVECTKTGTFLIVPVDCAIPSCTATATPEPTGLTVTFSATTVLGNCAPAVGTHYRWSFGDGAFEMTGESTTTHTYAQPGDYSWTFTAGVGPKDYVSFQKCEKSGTVHVQTRPCLDVGALRFCADTISDPDAEQNRTLRGNVSVNGMLYSSADAVFQGDPTSGTGTFTSQGDFAVNLAGGSLTVLTGPEKFSVDGAQSRMTPSLEPYFYFTLDGVTLYQSGAPFTFSNEGLYVKPDLFVGSKEGYALASLEVNLLLPPGGSLQVKDAEVAKVFDPVYIAASPQLTYAAGKLGGTLDLVCPSFSPVPIHTRVKALGGGICALDPDTPIPISAQLLPQVAWTNRALSVVNICNGPEGTPPLKGILYGDLYRPGLDPAFFETTGGEYVRLPDEETLTCRLRKGKLTLPLGEVTLQGGGLRAAGGDMVLEAVGPFAGAPYLEGRMNPATSIPVFGSTGRMQYSYEGQFEGTVHILPPYCSEDGDSCSTLTCLLREKFGANPWDLGNLKLPLFGSANPFDQKWKCVIGWFVRIGALYGQVWVGRDQNSGPRLTVRLEDAAAPPVGPRKRSSAGVERGYALSRQEDWAIFSAQGTIGTPSIYLKLPSGETVTPANASGFPGITYASDTGEKVALFLAQAAPAGTWTLGESNLPETEVTLDARIPAPPPALEFQSVTHTGDSVQIRCSVSPPAAGATVSILYGTTSDGRSSGVISMDLAADSGTVQATWNTSALPSGTYYLTASGLVAGGALLQARWMNPVTVTRPGPQPPSGLGGSVAGDTVSLSWIPSSSPSAAGYTVLYTDSPESAGYAWAVEAPAPDRAVLSDLDPEKNYRFTVVAHDGQGNRSTESNSWETAVCTVEAAPEVPAFIGKVQSVAFYARPKVAHCAGPVTYHWTFGDGATSSQENPGRGFSYPGRYEWTLTVSAGGISKTYSGVLIVTEQKSCALNCWTATPQPGKAGEPIAFASFSVSEGCMGTVAFAWDFGDGAPMATTQDATHPYAAPGTYIWTHTQSIGGNTCSESHAITISASTPGDCDGSGDVSIGEVQKAINMFLGSQATGCGVDCNGDGTVSIGEVQKVINGFLGLGSHC